MGVFETVKKAVKGWMQTMGAESGLGREFADIFELDGVPAYREFYNLGIFPWKYVYKGFYTPWHVISAPTIADKNNKRHMAHMDMGKAVCAELAGLIWTDQAEITITTNGIDLPDGDPDPLQKFVEMVLKKNNFSRKMQELIEQSAALGGAAMKVWRDVKRDRNGNEIAGTDMLKVGYCQADQFVPVSWDNAGVSEGIFISRIARGGYYYTRLEWHRWDGLTYYVTNELYKAEMKKNGSPEAQDILGFRIPLTSMYPFLDDEATISGLEKSLFTYFRPPIANNIDDNSPLGISVYANAMETLHALDICFDSFIREFKLGKKRIIVPARMIKTVMDPVTGEMRRYFDATDETYEALSTDDPDQLRIQDNSVELRVDEHVGAINAFLNVLCLQIGLSFGTFSFDIHGGLKTATEVISQDSKTYKTIKNYQNMIRPAVEDLVDSIIMLGRLYGMEIDGVPISTLAEHGYEVAVSMDDGITQDRQTNINEGITLVGAGLISKKTFLTDPKYGQGLTDEAADQELMRIAKEARLTSGAIDLITLGTAE